MSYTLALSLCVCLFGSVPGNIDSDANEYLRVYNTLDKLVALIRSSTRDPTNLSELNVLQKILEGDGPAQMT